VTLRPFYSDGRITLYRGDCRDVLPAVLERESVDLLLTDPPYGQQFESAAKAAKGAALGNVRADGARQGMRVARGMLEELADHWHPAAHAYLFTHWEGLPDFYDAASPHLSIRNALVWDKAAGGTGDTELDYARDFEHILYGIRSRLRPLAGRRDGAVLRGFRPVPTAQRIHPTEKPVSLLRYLIAKSAPPGGLVVDAFAGSSSTLLAAKLEGRRAVGVEVDGDMCEKAARRLDQEVIVQPTTWAPRGSGQGEQPGFDFDGGAR
jgi:DNA modification methylase